MTEMFRQSLIDVTGTVNLEWDEVHSIIDELAETVEISGDVYSVIIGINRGGLIPSVLLSHRLGIKHGAITYQGNDNVKGDKIYQHVSMIGELDKDSRVLLIDDIADTGHSIQNVIYVLKKLGCEEGNIDTATLHYKTKSIFRPTYVGDYVNDKLWINYPWEQK